MCATVTRTKGSPTDRLVCLAKHKAVATAGGYPQICHCSSSSGDLTGEEQCRGCSVVIRTTNKIRRGIVVNVNGELQWSYIEGDSL